MFVSAVKKAHDAVEGAAYEAALMLAAVMLACLAVLLAAGGLALWLAVIMPFYAALFTAAAIVAVIAGIVFQLSRMGPPKSEEKPQEDKTDSPLSSMTKSLNSIAGPMDVMASGLFARQFRKAPVSTIAATVAIGAVLGMIASSQDD